MTNEAAIMVSYSDDDDNAEAKEVELLLKNFTADFTSIKIFLLEKEHDMELIREEKIDIKKNKIILNMPLLSTYFVQLKADN